MKDQEKQITAIIADDESLARNVIKKYLVSFPMIRIVAECENGLATLNSIHDLKPDLLFLDIQMPDLDGLSVLNELREPPLVIFTTAYNEYAIKAFEKDAIDYLLKPFDMNRFSHAIEKMLEYKSSSAFLSKKLSVLQHSLDEILNAGKKFMGRILIKGKEGYSFLNVNDIMWFEAHSDYVKIHSKSKVDIKNISLNELEQKLNPKTFIRIHRSTIVNIDYIKELKPYFNGEYHLILMNGEKLKLSRTYKENLKHIIDESL